MLLEQVLCCIIIFITVVVQENEINRRSYLMYHDSSKISEVKSLQDQICDGICHN